MHPYHTVPYISFHYPYTLTEEISCPFTFLSRSSLNSLTPHFPERSFSVAEIFLSLLATPDAIPRMSSICDPMVPASGRTRMASLATSDTQISRKIMFFHLRNHVSLLSSFTASFLSHSDVFSYVTHSIFVHFMTHSSHPTSNLLFISLCLPQNFQARVIRQENLLLRQHNVSSRMAEKVGALSGRGRHATLH